MGEDHARWVVAITAIMVITGCPRPVPPPVPAPTWPSCAIAAEDLPRSADVCAGRFTIDLRACTRCRTARACLDVVDGLYCVDSEGCADRACRTAAGP